MQYLLVGAISLLLFFYVLTRGYREGLYHRYPIFYIYVGSMATLDGLIWAWILASGVFDLSTGENTEAYFYVYWFRETLIRVLEFTLLFGFFTRFRFGNTRWLKTFFAGCAVLVTAILLYRGGLLAVGDTYMIGNVVSMQLLALFCAVTLGYVALNRRLMIGWNEFAIVTGLALQILIQYLLWVAGTLMEYRAVSDYLSPVEIIPALIWVITLNKYHPTQELPGEEFPMRGQDFEDVVRSLLRR